MRPVVALCGLDRHLCNAARNCDFFSLGWGGGGGGGGVVWFFSPRRRDPRSPDLASFSSVMTETTSQFCLLSDHSNIQMCWIRSIVWSVDLVLQELSVSAFPRGECGLQPRRDIVDGSRGGRDQIDSPGEKNSPATGRPTENDYGRSTAAPVVVSRWTSGEEKKNKKLGEAEKSTRFFSSVPGPI